MWFWEGQGRFHWKEEKSKECEITYCATPTFFLFMTIRFTVILSATGGITIQQPRLVCCFLFEEGCLCGAVQEDQGSPGSPQQTSFFCTGRFSFFFFLFVHVAQLSIALGRHTLPHVRAWNGGKHKDVYIWCRNIKRINLWFRLCCCLIAGITQTRIRGFGRGETKCACKLSPNEYTEKKPTPLLSEAKYVVTSCLKQPSPVTTWMINWHSWLVEFSTDYFDMDIVPAMIPSLYLLLVYRRNLPQPLYWELKGKIHSKLLFRS